MSDDRMLLSAARSQHGGYVQTSGLSLLRYPAAAALRTTVVLPVVSLVVWSLAISRVDMRGTTDLGLISVLPPLALVAVILLLVSFALTLREEPVSTPVALLHVLALVWMLYGVTIVVEEAPRFAIAYRHIGLAEYISRNHAVDPLIDAYHNWPGFFSLSALISDSAGLATGV